MSLHYAIATRCSAKKIMTLLKNWLNRKWIQRESSFGTEIIKWMARVATTIQANSVPCRVCWVINNANCIVQVIDDNYWLLTASFSRHCQFIIKKLLALKKFIVWWYQVTTADCGIERKQSCLSIHMSKIIFWKIL